MGQREDFLLAHYPSFTPEKNEIVLFDESGLIPTGPVIARYHKTGHIYVAGIKAEIAGFDDESGRVVISWPVETAGGWSQQETSLKYWQLTDLLYGPHEWPGRKHDVLHKIQDALQVRAGRDYIKSKPGQQRDFYLLIDKFGEAWNDLYNPSQEDAAHLTERLIDALSTNQQWTVDQQATLLQKLGENIEHRLSTGTWPESEEVR